MMYQNRGSDASGTWAFAVRRPGSRKRSRKVLLGWLLSQCKLLSLCGSPQSKGLPALVFKQTILVISAGILLKFDNTEPRQACSTWAEEEDEPLALCPSSPVL